MKKIIIYSITLIYDFVWEKSLCVGILPLSYPPPNSSPLSFSALSSSPSLVGKMCGSFSWPILLQIPQSSSLWPFLGALGVCQAIYFWWVSQKKKILLKKKKRRSKRKEDEEERRRWWRRSGFKSAVIFAGIWSVFFGVWSFDGGK